MSQYNSIDLAVSCW